MSYAHLLSPLALPHLTLPNRVIMGSMHTNLEESGEWDRLAAFYAERARGGVGLIVTGGIAPCPEGAVFQGAAGLYDDADIARHRLLTGAVHAGGGRIAMQILHAGRYAYSPACVAPSAVKSPISPFAPAALDEPGIAATIAAYADTAARAIAAGYDGVEIMGSEGYLINQFLCAHTNHRSDDWGGSPANRMRFALRVVAAVRAALGPEPLLIYRISLMDLIPDGQSWDEVLELARGVQAAGATLLNTGIGWHEARIPTIAASVPRAAFAGVTARLRAAVDLPVIACNRINTPEVAEGIIARGEADLVSLARPFLADADFVAKAAAGRADLIAPCIACNQACLDHTFAGRISTCLVNPRAAHETLLRYDPAPVPRRIAIAGAGPAGMMAAIVAAGRGHRVTLYESGARIGGQMQLAATIPGKDEFRGLIDWFAAMLRETGVDLRLNTPATPDLLARADEVIIATGVTPRDPGLPGQDLPHVLRYPDLLAGAPAGDRVAVIGAGGIGFDVASYLIGDVLGGADWAAHWGIAPPDQARGGLAPGGAPRLTPRRQVTLMQRKPGKPGKGLGKTTGWIHRLELARAGVRMLGGVQYDRITPEGVQITGPDGPALIAADTVVLCTGQEPARALADALPQAHVIGGAERAAELDAKTAIATAARLAALL